MTNKKPEAVQNLLDMFDAMDNGHVLYRSIHWNLVIEQFKAYANNLKSYSIEELTAIARSITNSLNVGEDYAFKRIRKTLIEVAGLKPDRETAIRQWQEQAKIEAGQAYNKVYEETIARLEREFDESN